MVASVLAVVIAVIASTVQQSSFSLLVVLDMDDR
jgi:hypothetical protein